MKTRTQILFFLLFMVNINPLSGQEESYALTFSIYVDEDIRPLFNSDGRLFITLSTTSDAEPKDQIWPNSIAGRHYFFAKNIQDWDPEKILDIQDTMGWSAWGRTDECTFSSVPGGTYYIQVLWQQHFYGFGNKEAGNLFSKKQEILLDRSQQLDINLTEQVEPVKLLDNPHVKMVDYKSDTLSKWWGMPIYEKAVVLLPSGYFDNPEERYPIFFTVGGGDSHCINSFHRRWKGADSKWWFGDDAPQVIVVFLDGSMNSNIYHLDSDNLGPHGHSLIYEFIPYIEKKFRAKGGPEFRYIGGCSTGGYGSLALQVFYPEAFNGVFCFGPDPITFNKHMNVNLYKDPNFFFDQYGYQRLLKEPGWSPHPISWKDWLEFENVMGNSGTYLDSDHVLGTWSAIFGPKGLDGKPIPLIDPESGEIDHLVAKTWARYDLRRYVRSNWEEIGHELENKILICTEATDNYNLNLAVRSFELGIRRLENPRPNAVIIYSDSQGGHCSSFWTNYRTIIEGIAANKKPVELKDQIR